MYLTCEVAVLNKRGVALTADSAVTLTDGTDNEGNSTTQRRNFLALAYAPRGDHDLWAGGYYGGAAGNGGQDVCPKTQWPTFW